MTRRSRRTGAVLVLALLTLGSNASAQTVGRPAAGGVAQGLSTTGGTTTQRLAASLNQIHANVCGPAIQQVAAFLLEGQEANFTIQPLGPNADSWPMVVVMESAHPSVGHTRFSTIVAAPNGGCSGMYEQTIYWAEPCTQLKKTVFAAFQGAHMILKDVQASEANAGLQLYLMPGGAGCVSVKKELFR